MNRIWKMGGWVLVFQLVALGPFPCFGQNGDEGWDDRFGSLGLSATAHALATSGANVYAGGSFTTAGGLTALRVAKWNGMSWSALGGGRGVGNFLG